MTLNIRRKRHDMTNFSQTLNYVLVHATKPGSEAHPRSRRIMRQSYGFEAWLQLTLHYAGQQQKNSHDNTTHGWKTSTDTNQKTDKEQLQIT
eukprot:1779508-Amphidinium_carterae.7